MGLRKALLHVLERQLMFALELRNGVLVPFVDIIPETMVHGQMCMMRITASAK